jgi:hypothetical protein
MSNNVHFFCTISEVGGTDSMYFDSNSDLPSDAGGCSTLSIFAVDSTASSANA